MPDEDLGLYQLHCRYCISVGLKMKEAAAIWNEMKGRFASRGTHMSALTARLRAERPQGVAAEHLGRDSQAPGRTSSSPQPSVGRRDQPSFSHAEVFPLIARLIIRAPADRSGFVAHDAIVAAVLADAEGAAVTARARTMSSWPDDRSAASNMVAWFSQQITAGRSLWAEFFDRERQDGAWAYRPRTAVPPPIVADIDLSAIEGEPRMFFHVRRERDARLVDAKRLACRTPDGRLPCEACGFVMQSTYPGLPGELCEIHHRLPLAEATEATETRLDDLAVLCPNCHRAIHRTRPLMSIDEFRAAFLGVAV